MTTFSQLVDELAAELLRPDQKANIAAYLNQSIREMHFKSNAGMQAPAFFGSNRFEAEETITSTGMYVWTIPAVARFQALEAAFVPNVGDYWRAKNPRSIHRDRSSPFPERYYYRSGGTFAFNAMVAGWTLQLSWFEYPRQLVYLAEAERVVTWRSDTDSYVLVAGGGEPTEEQLLAATNWLLQRWPDQALKEGVRAKVWKRLGDESRAKMAFSAFEAARQMVWSAEDVVEL